ncbi:hypothetical protein D3C72_1701960 [compost metagenome]
MRAATPNATSMVCTVMPRLVPTSVMKPAARPSRRERLIHSVMSGPGVTAKSRIAMVNAMRVGRLGTKSMRMAPG